MRSFLAASAAVFTVVCAAWATRLILGTPVRVNGYDVPVMLSVIPMLITGAMAYWAVRLMPQVKTQT
jgi:hypothetical protein